MRDDGAATSADAVQRWLFAPTDARMVALLRILLAGILAWAFWSSGLELNWPWPRFRGLEGMYERVFLTRGYAMSVLALLALFAAGVRPRVTGLMLVAMLLPLAFLSRGQQSRQVLIFALLAFVMLRSDAAMSVRTWIGGATHSSAGPMWPIRLMQVQLSLVYLVNAIAKSSPAYLSGEVLVGMARMRPNIAVDLSDGYLHLGPIMMPVALAAVGSAIVEYYLAIGFWIPRLRFVTAAVGVGFHLLLMWMMDIFMLDIACMFLYLVFLLPLVCRTGATSGLSSRAPVAAPAADPASREAGSARARG
jgi:hypothetical protein